MKRFLLLFILLLPFWTSCSKGVVVIENSPKNLSEKEVANCYLVTAPGEYQFGAAYKGCDAYETIEELGYEAIVLWENDGEEPCSLIENVRFERDIIYFNVPSPMTNGNALVALTNEDGDILWSWHLWLLEGANNESLGCSYANDAGTVMICNVGATSLKTSSPKNRGLLYQWGRKDPFSPVNIQSGKNWKIENGDSKLIGNEEYTILNPCSFITGNSQNHDWLYPKYEGYLDKTRWAENGSKRKYDPCPPGWRVMDGTSEGNPWYNSSFSSTNFTWPWERYGMDFNGKYTENQKCFYPAAGYISGHTGVFDYEMNTGCYWTTMTKGVGANSMILNKNRSVFPTAISILSDACSIRCQKDNSEE